MFFPLIFNTEISKNNKKYIKKIIKKEILKLFSNFLKIN